MSNRKQRKFLITSIVILLSINSAMYVSSQVVLYAKIYLVFFIVLCIGIGVWFLQNSRVYVVKQGIYIFGLLAILSSVLINPIASSTSAIYSSEPAGIISLTPKSAVWASDNFVGDAYLMSLGRASVSGQQLNGPIETLWRKFDRNLAYRNVWNKGQSYVLFSWQPDVNATFREEQPDQINILINPCSPILDEFKVEFIISSKPLSEYPCLRALNSEPIIKPNGPMWLYAMQN